MEDFRELLPKSYACREQYHLLRIPLEDGRFELVSTSLVEIEYTEGRDVRMKAVLLSMRPVEITRPPQGWRYVEELSNE